MAPDSNSVRKFIFDAIDRRPRLLSSIRPFGTFDKPLPFARIWASAENSQAAHAPLQDNVREAQ